MSSRNFSLALAPNDGVLVLPDVSPSALDAFDTPPIDYVLVVSDVVDGVVYTSFVDASIALAAVPEAPMDGQLYGRGMDGWTPVLPLTGGTLSGLLILSADPTANLGAATKQYVDSAIFRAGGPFLQLGGGTLSGPLVLHADPQVPLGAATRQYVDAVRAAIPGGAPVQSVAGRTGAIVLTHNDITDWTATLAPYALVSQIPVGATALPLMAGTAAVGAGVAWARGDHVHPSDTSRLALTGGVMTGGISFGANTGTTPSDFSKHLALWNPGYGISVTPNRLNIVTGTTLVICIGANDLATFSGAAGGLVMAGTNTVTLGADPNTALQAATKQYVDARAWQEAPNNTTTYGRRGLNWVWIGAHTSVGGGTFDPLTDIPAGYIGTYQITNQTGAAGWPAGNSAQTAFILAGYNSNTGWPNKLMMGGYRLANGEAPLWYSTNDNIWELVLTSAGGTLNTGKTITLGADPTAAMHAVTKQYFDAHAAGLTDAPADGFGYGRVNQAWARVLPLTGGTVSGQLTVTGMLDVGPTTAGYLQLSPGNATNTGYVAFYNAANVRQGYFGYASGGQLVLTLEDVTHAFVVNGNLGLNIGVPAGQMAAAASGGWMFGWGITFQNWGSNLYYGSDSAWHYWGAGPALLAQEISSGWGWLAAPNGSAGGVATLSGKMSLDLSGNLNIVGSFSCVNINATNITGSTTVISNAGVYAAHAIANNYVLYGDGTYLYMQFESGWYWAWNRSSGGLAWVYGGTTLLLIDSGGSITTPGNITASGNINIGGSFSGYAVTVSHSVSCGNQWFGPGGNGCIFNWASGWYLDWNATNGTLTWISPGVALWWADASGNIVMTGSCYAASYPGPSDARLKKNIQPWLDRGLAEIVQLQPVSFQFNGEGGLADDGVTRYGVIAQDAEMFLPEAVHVMPPPSGPEQKGLDDQLAFDNGTLLFAMVNAIKELAARVSALEMPA